VDRCANGFDHGVRVNPARVATAIARRAAGLRLRLPSRAQRVEGRLDGVLHAKEQALRGRPWLAINSTPRGPAPAHLNAREEVL
jgi:hypothetical protein